MFALFKTLLTMMKAFLILFKALLSHLKTLFHFGQNFAVALFKIQPYVLGTGLILCLAICIFFNTLTGNRVGQLVLGVSCFQQKAKKRNIKETIV